MIRLILALVVWYFSFGLAATYGGIWHSQSNPTPNAHVQIIGGAAEVGTLRRAWDRDWSLTRADGSELRVSDSDMVLSVGPSGRSLTYWQLWRAWVPVATVTCGFVLFVIWPGLRQLTKRPLNIRN